MTKRTPKWLLVDWVYLGMLGWDIDESGAGFDGGEYAGGALYNHCHLDRLTLDLHLFGEPEFCTARMRQLAQADVPGIGTVWNVTLSTNAGGTFTSAANGSDTVRYLKVG